MGKLKDNIIFTKQNPCGLGILDYFGNKTVNYFK